MSKIEKRLYCIFVVLFFSGAIIFAIHECKQFIYELNNPHNNDIVRVAGIDESWLEIVGLEYSFDEIWREQDHNNDLVTISGWAVGNQDETGDTNIRLILASDSNTYIVNTELSKREDVVNSLNINISDVGFKAIFPVNLMEQGTYKIGFLFGTDNCTYVWTNKQLNTLAPQQELVSEQELASEQERIEDRDTTEENLVQTEFILLEEIEEVKNLENVINSNGNISVEITGNDPQIAFKKLDKVELVSGFEVHVEGVTKEEEFQIFYSLDNDEFSEENSIRFKVLPNQYEYSISLEKEVNINLIRFDVGEGKNQGCKIRLEVTKQEAKET